jgi:hypothetical protein
MKPCWKSGLLGRWDKMYAVATVASAILFDYEALLEEKIARKTG